MGLNAVRQPVGCLLIGESLGMDALCQRLNARGVATVVPSRGGNLLRSVQEGFLAARRPGGACIAAEGEMWAAALSLAAQLSVDRVALIEPLVDRRTAKDDREKQIERLKGFARRNLFFCVCDVLILEADGDVQTSRRLDRICRMLGNARVSRCLMTDQRWTNCEFSPLEAAARFLECGDLQFSLAKSF